MPANYITAKAGWKMNCANAEEMPKNRKLLFSCHKKTIPEGESNVYSLRFETIWGRYWIVLWAV